MSFDDEQSILKQKSAELSEKAEELREKSQELRLQFQDLFSRREELRAKAEEIRLKEEEIAQQEKKLKDEEYTSYNVRLKKDEELTRRETALNNKEEELQQREEKLTLKLMELQTKESELLAKSEELKQLAAGLNKRRVDNATEPTSRYPQSSEDRDTLIRKDSSVPVKQPDGSLEIADALPGSEEDELSDAEVPGPKLKKMFLKVKSYYYNQDGELKLRAVAVMIIIFALLFVGGFVGTNLLMSVFVGRGQELAVPDLHNLHFDVARKTSMENDLFVQQIELRHDDEITVNRIISQTPAPGKKTKRNRTIEVVVSKGPELVRVPYLDSITEREARLRLENVGLRLGNKTHRYSNTVEKDRIINSQPVADSFVPRGSVVSIDISLGRLPDATDRHRRFRGVLDDLE